MAEDSLSWYRTRGDDGVEVCSPAGVGGGTTLSKPEHKTLCGPGRVGTRRDGNVGSNVVIWQSSNIPAEVPPGPLVSYARRDI